MKDYEIIYLMNDYKMYMEKCHMKIMRMYTDFIQFMKIMKAMCYEVDNL